MLGVLKQPATKGISMSYHHFTPVERGKLELMVKQGKSHQQIADELGFHRTSVLRELRRNGLRERYHAESAQKRYAQRRKACRQRPKLSGDTPFRDYVTDKIALEQWTPELVAGRLPLDYPGTDQMRVCHESIYQAIYKDGDYLDMLRPELPQARPKRRKRGQGKRRRGPSIPNRVDISERPAAVDKREEIGHWEGDTVVGKGQDGFAVTLVERTSRRLAAAKTRTKAALEVQQAVIEALQDHPAPWVKTITFDNGTEFAGHEVIAKELSVSVYFTAPYSAYQRGSNEQVNGLIRRYLPKGTAFRNLTQQQLDEIVEKINNRPRKCLGYRTPNEVFKEQREQHLRALGS
jgi:transposase, IS30 family